MKPKPPVSLWIRSERKRHGWKVEELSRRLVEMGYEAQVPTVRVWEAGRSPRPDTVEALERLFGSTAPREQEATFGGDQLAALTRAIEAQTAAMNAVVRELAQMRSEQDGRAQGFVEALSLLEQTLRGREHEPREKPARTARQGHPARSGK